MEEDIGKKLKQAVEKMQKENDINSAIYIIEKCILGSWVIKGYRVNPVRQALKVVLKRIKELEKEINNSYNTVVKLTRENTKLKHDLFRSISKEKVREMIKKYKEMSDDFYIKFLEGNRLDKDIHDVGIACDAKVKVLQELLKK